MVQSARRAEGRGDWPAAGGHWRRILKRAPDHAPAVIGAGRALRESGRLDEAEQVLALGAQRIPDDARVAIAHAWTANARRDWPAALSRWQALCARFPDNPWCYVGMISAVRGGGGTEPADALCAEARRALAASVARGMDEASATQVEFEIARASLDWPALRRLAQKIIEAGAGTLAPAHLALAQASWRLGDLAAADRAADRALADDPTLAEALVVRAMVATDRGDGEAALASYRALAALNPGAVRWRLKVVQLLNWFGRVKEAVSELETLRAQWPHDPMVTVFLRNYGPAAALNGDADGFDLAAVQELRTLVARAPDPALLARPSLTPDPESEVLIAEAKGSPAAVLVFAGSNDAVAMPLEVFDLYLATLPASAIYLKDFQRLRFLRGIRSLSGDFAGTLAALKATLGRLGARRLFAIGTCDGGFAAIRYGVELGAERILTFNAPTYSPGDGLAKLEQARNFMRNRLAQNVPAEMMDLKPFLEGRRHAARIELYYEAEDESDQTHAVRLAGLAGVTLHPQPGLSNHRRLLRMLALSNENFPGLLSGMLGIGRDAPKARR
jgi:tetratricopeptide (TPR) repeat protein